MVTVIFVQDFSFKSLGRTDQNTRTFNYPNPQSESLIFNRLYYITRKVIVLFPFWIS